MMKVGDTVVLSGISNKGKARLQEFGRRWQVKEIRGTVADLWPIEEPRGTRDRSWGARWVALTGDRDFRILPA